MLDVLLRLFNMQHTALGKTVSHKTRHERARFLRRFFRDLVDKAGFRRPPDPRNLGQKHVQAMVQVWQRERLAPATIQTYLSFLRGLASWLDKPGLVRPPAHYGLRLEEYERHEYAQRDKSWRAQGLDVEQVLQQVAAFDPRIAACMRLMHVFGLRDKESVMLRPHAHVVPFAQTGLPDVGLNADDYLWVKGKGGRVRWIAIDADAQRLALAQARTLVTGQDASMGDPARTLRQNLRRLMYVLEKFGITRRAAGTTGHGLRHGHVNDLYEQIGGVPSPVRGGPVLPPVQDRAARKAVAERAGHARLRASGAYIGSVTLARNRPSDRSAEPPCG
ncbi:phage integrase N-terminal domain-containing protein [Pseudorhodoferax sp. Leaf267]|uniref:phage integrase N-terminal domain-containing protein n=1 Tax=Pseudorhodoferax sp. Leaf267 TaxID=1736316 RepID=UPI001F3404B3|nr:phage integrase N-terminal domain-containing protein [Pseudorhodoferax sp. Leaf267]